MKKRKYNVGGMTGMAPQVQAGLGALGQTPQAIVGNQQSPQLGPQSASLYPGPVGTFPTANVGSPFKKGGSVKGFKKGGSVKSSASRRGDGIAVRGKTRG